MQHYLNLIPTIINNYTLFIWSSIVEIFSSKNLTIRSKHSYDSRTGQCNSLGTYSRIIIIYGLYYRM